METKIEENNIEKSLVKKSGTSLKNRNVNMAVSTMKITVGILFYVASFIISATASSLFIYYVFQQLS